MAEQRQDQNRQQQSRQPQQQSDQSQQGQGGVSGLGDSSASRSSGQQGGQSSAGQQQQFERGRGQEGGGSPGDNRFAEHIREHMEVIDDAGRHCGTVDHVDGDRIKLARTDSNDGQHHYVPLSQVAGIEGNQVRLRERGDNDFGIQSDV